MKFINRLADACVSLLLKTEDAGACVPEQGQCCSTRHLVTSCTGLCVSTSIC